MLLAAGLVMLIVLLCAGCLAVTGSTHASGSTYRRRATYALPIHSAPSSVHVDSRHAHATLQLL